MEAKENNQATNQNWRQTVAAAFVVKSMKMKQMKCRIGLLVTIVCWFHFLCVGVELGNVPDSFLCSSCA